MKSIRQAVRAPASGQMLKAAIVAGVGAWVGSAAPVRANPADIFGLGAREAAMGNAFTAIADDPFAAYYNMAGLAQIKRTTLSIGLQLGHMSFGDSANCKESQGVGCSEPFYYTQAGVLTEQQKRYGYDEPHGISIGLAVPLFKRLTFGLSMYLPLDVRYDENGKLSGVGVRLTRLMTTDPYLPDYVMYQNRPQRFSAYSGLAFEIMPGLGIGIGTSILASAKLGVGIGGTLDVSPGADSTSENPTTQVTTKVNSLMTMDLAPTASVVGGVLWNLGTISPSLQNWQLGLTYRGKSSLGATAVINADVAVAAQLSADQQPLSYGLAVAGIELTVLDFYTPQQVSFGVSGLFADRLRVAVDASWVNWKAFMPSMANIPSSTSLPLGLSLDVENARTVENENYRDTIVPRLGLEGRLGPYMTSGKLKGMDVYLRAGGSFEQNPFPKMNKYNNLLNSDTLKMAAGLGLTTHNPFATERDLPVSVDFSFQYHYLLPTEDKKDLDTTKDFTDGVPVNGVYVSQGSVMQGALTLQLGF